jgi:hypothetical protein
MAERCSEAAATKVGAARLSGARGGKGEYDGHRRHSEIVRHIKTPQKRAGKEGSPARVSVSPEHSHSGEA